MTHFLATSRHGTEMVGTGLLPPAALLPVLQSSPLGLTRIEIIPVRKTA